MFFTPFFEKKTEKKLRPESPKYAAGADLQSVPLMLCTNYKLEQAKKIFLFFFLKLHFVLKKKLYLCSKSNTY